jgi:hypothetical protein
MHTPNKKGRGNVNIALFFSFSLPPFLFLIPFLSIPTPSLHPAAFCFFFIFFLHSFSFLGKDGWYKAAEWRLSGDTIRILKNPFPVYRGLRRWKWLLPPLVDCFTRYMWARRRKLQLCGGFVRRLLGHGKYACGKSVFPCSFWLFDAPNQLHMTLKSR